MSRVYAEVDGGARSGVTGGDEVSWCRAIICDRCGKEARRVLDRPSEHPFYPTEKFPKGALLGWGTYEAGRTDDDSDSAVPLIDFCAECNQLVIQAIFGLMPEGPLRENRTEKVKLVVQEWSTQNMLPTDSGLPFQVKASAVSQLTYKGLGEIKARALASSRSGSKASRRGGGQGRF